MDSDNCNKESKMKITKVVINPKYEKFAPFINNIWRHDYNPDKIYRNYRNTVESVTIDGVKFVVKKFKKPTEFNRFVYTFLRPTKAKRSYEYSLRLLNMGFETPEPVGYMEMSLHGIFHTGYYVCLYTDYRSIGELMNLDFYDKDPSKISVLKEFIYAFAAYCVDLHKHHVTHNDYNKENILYKVIDGKFHFALIDVNRSNFRTHSRLQFTSDLANLGCSPLVVAAIVVEYCKIRGWDYAQVGMGALYNAERLKNRRSFRARLCKFLGIKRGIDDPTKIR
ncbi:MAG: hypothetical protein LKM37_01340 [Bacteroidales bacterium]|jgi:serine/threonine protein kinase|nr:hypothetical protein [Bacteroidales bacterium]MCI1733138.1 hypothetical protein [Bacteroidales bacterium]